MSRKNPQSYLSPCKPTQKYIDFVQSPPTLNQDLKVSSSSIFPSYLFKFDSVHENNSVQQCPQDTATENQSNLKRVIIGQESAKHSDAMDSYRLSQSSQMSENDIIHDSEDANIKKPRESLRQCLYTPTKNRNISIYQKNGNNDPQYLPQYSPINTSQTPISNQLPNTISNSNYICNKAILLKKYKQNCYYSQIKQKLQQLFGKLEQSKIIQQQQICHEIANQQYIIINHQINSVINQIQQVKKRVQRGYSIRNGQIQSKKTMEKQNMQRIVKEKYNIHQYCNKHQQVIRQKERHQQISIKPTQEQSSKSKNNKKASKPPKKTDDKNNKILQAHTKNQSNIVQIVQPKINGLKNEDEILLVKILFQLGYLSVDSIINTQKKYNDNNHEKINQSQIYDNSSAQCNKLTKLLKEAKQMYLQKKIKQNVHKMKIREKLDITDHKQSSQSLVCDENSHLIISNENHKKKLNLQKCKFPKVPSVIMDVCQLANYQQQNNYYHNSSLQNDIQLNNEVSDRQEMNSHQYINQCNHTESQYNESLQQESINMDQTSQSIMVDSSEQRQSEESFDIINNVNEQQSQQDCVKSVKHSFDNKCMNNKFVQTFIQQFDVLNQKQQPNANLQQNHRKPRKMEIVDQNRNNNKISKNNQKKNSSKNNNNAIKNVENQNGRGFASLKKLMVNNNYTQIHKNRYDNSEKEKVSLPFTRFIKKRYNQQNN